MSDQTEGIVSELANAQTEQPEVSTEPESYLGELVGDGKQYADPESLAKGKAHADKHIETILAEKRELEKALEIERASKTTMEEVVAMLNKEPAPEPQPASQSGVTGVSQEDVLALVENAIDAKSRAQAVKAARAKIHADLADEFGSIEAAQKAINNYANGDKTKLAAMDTLIVADYSAALKLIKPEAESVTFGEDQPGVTVPQTPSGLTWSKCQQIKKDNPREYNSGAFQRMMHQAAAINPDFMKT